MLLSEKSLTFAEKITTMNKTAPEILQLRLDIEESVKRKIRTPYDFEFLTGAIWERLHENISPTTLKRLWGYIEGADTTRRTTLCLLAKFLGYADWEAYLDALNHREGVESEAFMGEGVHTADLEKGQLVEVAWLPNRTAVFRYLGVGKFEVVKAENAKIHQGDSFRCSFMLVGQPMYLDDLQQVGREEPVNYVAGSKNGLSKVKILND